MLILVTLGLCFVKGFALRLALALGLGTLVAFGTMDRRDAMAARLGIDAAGTIEVLALTLILYATAALLATGLRALALKLRR